MGWREIGALAARQHGVATTRQLHAEGLTEDAIRERIRRGELHRLHRGVYLLGPIPLPLTRPMAAVLACGDGAALSHGWAAALWDLQPTPGGDVDVTTTRGARSRAGIRVHRTSSLEATTADAIPVTTPLRTLLDLAAAGQDVTRLTEQAQVRGLLQTGAIPSRPGAAALRTALTDEPSLTRSEAERRLLELIRRARLPRPVTNTRVGRFEVDFLWPRERLVVEVDGYAFHRSRAAFERDRARDAALVAAGHRVIRLTWRMLEREPELVVARLATALA